MPQQIPLEEWLKTHCFTVMQTGPWEGPDSWCYRIYCLACDYEQLAYSRDEAWEIYRAHKPGSRVKPKKVPRGGTKKKIVGKRVGTSMRPSSRKVETVEWDEVFF